MKPTITVRIGGQSKKMRLTLLVNGITTALIWGEIVIMGTVCDDGAYHMMVDSHHVFAHVIESEEC